MHLNTINILYRFHDLRDNILIEMMFVEYKYNTTTHKQNRFFLEGAFQVAKKRDVIL